MKKIITIVCAILLLAILGGVAINNRKLQDKLDSYTDTDKQNPSDNNVQSESIIGTWKMNDTIFYEGLLTEEDAERNHLFESKLLYNFGDSNKAFTTLNFRESNDGVSLVGKGLDKDYINVYTGGNKGGMNIYVYSDEASENVIDWLNRNAKKVSSLLPHDYIQCEGYSVIYINEYPFYFEEGMSIADVVHYNDFDCFEYVEFFIGRELLYNGEKVRGYQIVESEGKYYLGDVVASEIVYPVYEFISLDNTVIFYQNGMAWVDLADYNGNFTIDENEYVFFKGNQLYTTKGEAVLAGFSISNVVTQRNSN